MSMKSIFIIYPIWKLKKKNISITNSIGYRLDNRNWRKKMVDITILFYLMLLYSLIIKRFSLH
jgi:hypothetical protein